MNRLSSILLGLALLLPSCAPAPTTAASRTLTVFAAASLTQAFEEIGQDFEKRIPGVDVTFNFAGSQALRTQVEQGARADVIATADTVQMQALASEGYVDQAKMQPLATNKLVVVVPGNNPADVISLQGLSHPGVKLVLAAEDVPAGKYARQAIGKMDARFGSNYQSLVLGNVVSNEDNVKQVLAKVQLGEADAGIVYSSDAVGAPSLHMIEIPPEFNVTAIYPIAALKSSQSADVAAAFVEYTRSDAARAVLAKWGFAPVP
jgi:molybdate transport system substrate-binding protein